MTDKITKDMTIGDIISKYPETVEVLAKHGFHCIGCPSAGAETLEQGAAAHGIDVDKLVKEMNEVLEKAKDKKE